MVQHNIIWVEGDTSSNRRIEAHKLSAKTSFWRHKMISFDLLNHTFSAIRVGFAAEIIVMGKAGHISHYVEGCSTPQLSSSSLLAGESTNIWNWSSVAEAIYLTSNLKMRNFRSGSFKPLLSAFGSAIVFLWDKLKVGSYYPEKLGTWHINLRYTICLFLWLFFSTWLQLCFWSWPDQETSYCWIGRLEI